MAIGVVRNLGFAFLMRGAQSRQYPLRKTMIMKRLSILSLALLAVAPLLAADSTPKEAVTEAAAALGQPTQLFLAHHSGRWQRRTLPARPDGREN